MTPPPLWFSIAVLVAAVLLIVSVGALLFVVESLIGEGLTVAIATVGFFATIGWLMFHR